MSFKGKRLRTALVAVLSLTVLSACSGSGEPSPSPEGSQSAPVVDPVSPSGSPTVDDSATPEETTSPEESPSPSPEVSISPSTDLSAITVVDGDTPEVKFEAPWGITSTTTRVEKPSDGAQKLTKDSVVTINYVGVNGRTGEVFDSSYERGQPSTFALQQVVPGFRLGLDGQTVGSRVLIGMPSEDGYPDGNPDGSIKPGDSLLFVVDIISANFAEATGETMPPVEGLPTVTVDGEGKPVAAIDKSVTPPAELKVAPLITGPGQAITAESQIQVKYRSWVWNTGEPFEEAWAPQSGRLSGLIEGWKQGLVGQKAGSRVLLVVPPALAYPEGRSQDPKLPAGQTLVYVIDILDVQNP